MDLTRLDSPQPRHRWSDTVTTTADPGPAYQTTPADNRPSSLRRAIVAAQTLACSFHARLFYMLALLLASATGLSANGNPCNCAINPTDAPLVEWDIPSPLDFSSGAIMVDVHSSVHKARLWFVSRNGDVRLFRFEPGSNMATQDAKWKSFLLQTDPPSVFTGGLHRTQFRIKGHKNDQWWFVRTHTTLQRIDTAKCTGVSPLETCERTTWLDQIADMGPDVVPHVSDLSTDDCHVYTTTALFETFDAPLPTPGLSYLQQLNPCLVNSYDPILKRGTTTVKRWQVGGSAGFCESATGSSPCISGVAVDPKNEYLVWFSQPGDNKIGQLNVTNNIVKRWSLSDLPNVTVTEPRQLQFDDDGTVWVVTGSGHLVHLDWKKNRMSAHAMPPTNDPGNGPDPFGVAPDHGAVGYTKSSMGDSKIGMLLPKANWVPAYPDSKCITPTTPNVDFIKDDAQTIVGTSHPMPKMAQAHATDKSDGLFIEAQVGGGDSDNGMGAPNGSFVPLGITPDFSRRVGSYFYAVGLNGDTGVNRLGHILLPFNRKDHGHARDDDDNDGQHHGNGDDDDDGVKDGDDDSAKHETRDRRQDDVPGGQSVDYPMTADANTLLLGTTLTSLDPGTMLAVEVYNPAGQLLIAPLPTPGVAIVTVPTLTAGTYTVRVKNLGITQATFTTNFLTRSAWPALTTLP